MVKKKRVFRKAPKGGRGKKNAGKKQEAADKPMWASQANMFGSAKAQGDHFSSSNRIRQKNPG